ncbi:hypothetical protein L7F22_061987 [Adiantum nelumboides]|nr:hypothetical protein [Adiantum nelumboides]
MLIDQDKKGRLYLVSALAPTNVDLKGKGGLRMAPEDALQEVLKVPLGSVTALALFNPSARSIILLLDHQYQNQANLLFHPLDNDSTLVLACCALIEMQDVIIAGFKHDEMECTNLRQKIEMQDAIIAELKNEKLKCSTMRTTVEMQRMIINDVKNEMQECISLRPEWTNRWPILQKLPVRGG